MDSEEKDICPGLNSRQLLIPQLPTPVSPTPSPGPTLEEASAWAQSFDKLMLTPAGRNAFREFLRTEFSEENMLFWMACEELKKEANKAMIEEKARIIYEDYISILSPKEVGARQRSRPWAQRTPSVSGHPARLPLLQNMEPPCSPLIIDLGSGGCESWTVKKAEC